MLHSNCQINYHFTAARKDLLERMKVDVADWEVYVPHWVMEFDIVHLPVDEERPITAAAMEISFKYWKITLTVYDRYFVKEDKERKLYFMHEMLHAHMGPIHDYIAILEENTTDEIASVGVDMEEHAVESITFMLKEIEKTKGPG